MTCVLRMNRKRWTKNRISEIFAGFQNLTKSSTFALRGSQFEKWLNSNLLKVIFPQIYFCYWMAMAFVYFLTFIQLPQNLLLNIDKSVKINRYRNYFIILWSNESVLKTRITNICERLPDSVMKTIEIGMAVFFIESFLISLIVNISKIYYHNLRRKNIHIFPLLNTIEYAGKSNISPKYSTHASGVKVFVSSTAIFVVPPVDISLQKRYNHL